MMKIVGRIMLVPAVLAGMSIAGCSSLIVLHNPTTGATAQCEADGNTYFNPAAAAEACAKGYEAAGYKRMGTY
jgi:ABC-type transport system substrate-binding protein